jgi:hypothetical protein
MNEDDSGLEDQIFVRLLRLNAVITGLITGLLVGFVIFAITIFLILKGGEVVGPNLSLLGQVLIGYEVTVAGSFIGLAYGLVLGFLAGYFFARMYNSLAVRREELRSGA